VAQELVKMSSKGLDRLAVVRKVLEGRLTQAKAGEFIGLSERQVRRLCASFEKRGPAGLVSGKRGQGYRRILVDIADGELNTRIVNTKDDADTYFASLGADSPDLSRKGTFTGEELVEGAEVEPEKEPQSPKKPKRKGPRRSSSVIPYGTKCRVHDRRIEDIFRELSKIDADKYPNASAVMLRILLELCVAHYLEKTEGMKEIVNAQKQKGGGRRDGGRRRCARCSITSERIPRSR
jgi:hypothetical protein